MAKLWVRLLSPCLRIHSCIPPKIVGRARPFGEQVAYTDASGSSVREIASLTSTYLSLGSSKAAIIQHRKFSIFQPTRNACELKDKNVSFIGKTICVRNVAFSSCWSELMLIIKIKLLQATGLYFSRKPKMHLPYSEIDGIQKSARRKHFTLRRLTVYYLILKYGRRHQQSVHQLIPTV